MKTIGIIIGLFLLSLALTAQPQATALTTAPGPKLKVVLTWTPVDGAAGYQVYRKPAGPGVYPTIPLNTSPVAPLATCASLQAVLIPNPDSIPWKAVQAALADSTVLFDPCQIPALPLNSPKRAQLLLMARINLPIARAMGLVFEDVGVVNGTAYQYRIVAVDASLKELEVVATDLSITAGLVQLLPPPDSLEAIAGDAAVQLLWEKVDRASAYRVTRSSSPLGPYGKVSPDILMDTVGVTIKEDTLPRRKTSFIDWMRYDDTGEPTAHQADGSAVYGPFNSYAYFYKVQTLDLLGRPGPATTLPVTATPQDSTPPAIPSNLIISADEANSRLVVSWQHVLSDVIGRRESPAINRYRLYRYEHSENPDSAATVVADFIPGPATPGVFLLEFADASPNLRADYGNKAWWYRLRAIDANGNESNYSMAAYGSLKDLTPPDITKGLVAEGFEAYIALRWDPNTEPDLDGYLIYRSLCHMGDYIYCDDQKPTHERPDDRPRKPCSGPFVLVGQVSADSAKLALEAGNFIFEDRSIPVGSPLCYAYWVKAVDQSGNRSGDWPKPSPAEEAEIVCQRLRDLTPPEPPLIAALQARNESVRVEWMGPPAQDTRAYHVYRAKAPGPDVEPADGDYVWVGGMTVEPPPGVPAPLTEPYKPVYVPADCGSIPVLASEYMSKGYLVDQSLKPHHIYWYKVTSIDFDGNESPLGQSIGVSTFTYTTNAPLGPLIGAVEAQESPCALVASWGPAFDPNIHAGFLVYRSFSAAGPYEQQGSLLMANSYTDTQVVRGRTYWYRVAQLGRDGQISPLSPPVSAKPN